MREMHPRSRTVSTGPATEDGAVFPPDSSTEDVSTDVLGVQISALTMPGAVERIERWIAEKDPHYVAICTVHTVMECRRDPKLRRAVNRAGMRTPDGMPLVWLSHRARHPEVTRIYGPDLMLELCARSGDTGHRHFFYGGGPGVAAELVNRLKRQFPDLKVAGSHTPPMMPVGAIESQETIDRINNSGADIVWVGLGTPKQDWWVANHRPLLNASVLIAVGAAFDFHSGRVRQAPRWMQRRGLEWLFRLSQDPKRLWKRYLVMNSEFVAELFLQFVKRLVGSTLKAIPE